MAVQVKIQESIAVPPERVIAAFLDLSSYLQWMTNMVEIEQLTTGGLQVGTKWRQVRLRFGDKATDRIEVLRLEPPRLYEVRVDTSRDAAEQGSYVFTFEFFPEGAGTRIQLVIKGTQGGPGWEGRGDMLTHALETILISDLASLKRYLESQA